MSFLTKLERLLGRFAIPNLALYLVICQILFWGLALLAGFDLERIALVPAAVFGGEVWRLVTFLFVPPSRSPLFIAFAWFLFYFVCSALEQHWGAFRFCAFFVSGWLLTAAAAFVTPLSYTTNYFLAGTPFLAFAFLYPDYELIPLLLFPVKA